MIAILYVEVADGFPSVIEKLEHVSLGNCLQLVTSFPSSSSEIIIRLECDDHSMLNQAVIQDFAGIEGVKRITTCVINKA